MTTLATPNLPSRMKENEVPFMNPRSSFILLGCYRRKPHQLFSKFKGPLEHIVSQGMMFFLPFL